MKKILKYFLSTIPLLVALNIIHVFAQKQGKEKIDSLLSVLKNNLEDTAKVNTLNALAHEFRRNNPDTAIILANKALALSINLNYKMGIANANLYMSMPIIIKGNYNEAILKLNEAIKLYDQLLITENRSNQTKILKQKARAINNFGVINYYKGNNSKALQNYFVALKIRKEIEDKNGMSNSYNGIGDIYITQGNYQEALNNYFSSLKICKEMGDKQGIVDTYLRLGGIYLNIANYPQALMYYSEALKIIKVVGDNTSLASAYNNIGTVYRNVGNYPKALENYFITLNILEKIDSKRFLSITYSNIGLIYTEQGNYTEALKNHFAALKISEAIEDKVDIAASYGNIGNVYYKLGNFPEALKNHFISLRFDKEIKDKHSLAACYGNIGNVYYEQGNYPEALKYYFSSLKMFEESGDKDDIGTCCTNIGIFFIRQKKYNNASQYLNKGLLLAKEIGSLNDLKESYSGLAILDSAKGKFKKALEHYKMYITYRDSLFNEDNTKKTVQFQMQYEFDKKESLAKAEQDKKDVIALKELQKQKLLRNGFTGGFAIVLLFAGVFFTQRNKISKGKKLSDELLLNILPSEVAEELKQNGSAVAKQFDDVTVIFTDFKDFTKISEKLSPTDLVAEIDTCFKAFDKIMGKYHIEKIKTIGDSYMAAGGLPVPNKTNAADVVNAALEIQQFMLEHAQQKKKYNMESFEIRIGIHTGPVVAGIVGIKKYSYDIWGDTVNIASRMESSGEAGKINISGSTYELVKEKFNCSHRGKIEAKNKGEIDMYFVESILIVV